MKQKKARTCWVARDADEHSPAFPYCVFSKKPSISAWGLFEEPKEGELFAFCREDFERFTRLYLEPGECKRIRISVEVL